MEIIIKYMLKNLCEKRIRLILVVFSIAVSSGLIFANEGFSRTIETMFIEANARWGANADLIIEVKKEINSEKWVDIDLETLGVDYDYAVPCIKMNGLYAPNVKDMQYLTIIGTTIDEFDIHNPVSIAKGSLKGFNRMDHHLGQKIIIGESFAIDQGLKIGDEIPIEFDGKTYFFSIAAISEPKGLFRREAADGGFGIIPLSFFEGVYKEKMNLLFLKLGDDKNVEEVYNSLHEKYSNYKVSYARNHDLLRAEINNYVMPFRISSISVILMSMFIIFTAFQLINMDRISSIGTIRSVGCSKKLINKLLLIESGLLGIIGGFLGCLMGIGVLRIINSIYFSSNPGFANPPIVYGMMEIGIAVFSAVVITMGSALIPIMKTTKIPIRNIILNDLSNNSQKAKIKDMGVLGLFLIAGSTIIPFFLPRNLTGMIIASILATGALVGLLFIIPKVINLMAKMVDKIPSLGYDISLGIENVRYSNHLINNSRLFAITIGIIAFINSIFFTLSADMERSFEFGSQYDVIVRLHSDEDEIIEQINKIDGVQKYSVVYSKYNLDIKEKNTFINTLYGISNESCFEYIDADPSQALEGIKNLHNGNTIVLTNIMKSKYNFKIGDRITIPFEGKTYPFTISGFLDSTLSIGHIGFISANTLKTNFGDFKKSVYIKGDKAPDIVKNTIKRTLMRQIINIQTKEEVKLANRDKVEGIFNSINIYANIAMFVGMIGIVNNIIASYLMRKRSLALYRCVGMSKKQIRRMLMTESVIIGLVGVVLGLAAMLCMSPNIPVIVSLFWGNVPIAYANEKYLWIAIIGILSMIIVSYIPAVKSNQLSIIESIQYE